MLHINITIFRGDFCYTKARRVCEALQSGGGGGLGACLPRKFLNLPALRLLLVASETAL